MKEKNSLIGKAYKPYSVYKHSNVEWLGNIPQHWNVKKIKRLCLVKRGASPRPIEDPAFFDENGEYAWVRIADVTASQRYLETTTQRLSSLGRSKSVSLKPGELFVSIAATVGKPIITKIKCCIHDGFVYFVGLRENREFLYYLLSCGEPYRGLGKLGTQLNLNTDTIGDIYLPIVASQEQDAIVKFLDRETGKIDASVAKNERLIELLQEKRAAVLTRAVTKGLDPTVPMKDSGLDWLGAIPKHWDLIPLKRLLGRCEYGISESLAGGGDVRVLTMAHIQDGEIVLPKEGSIHEIEEGLILDHGDLLFNRTNSRELVGKVGLFRGSHDDRVTFASYLVRMTPRPDVISEWLNYLLNSTGVLSLARSMAMLSVNQANLNPTRYSQIALPLPNEREQRAISEFLNGATRRIDNLTVKVCDVIARLKERRIALISAAVTGKIDVREEIA